MKAGIAAGVLYLCSSFLNVGALNADRKKFILPCYMETSQHRFAAVVGLALVPVVGTAYAVFDTGFVESGFDWKVGGCS
jgi:hypothetical protein